MTRFDEEQTVVRARDIEPRGTYIPELRVLAWVGIIFLFATAFAFIVARRQQDLESERQGSDRSAVVLSILLKQVPPGNTAFSVEPATSGMVSSFYGSPVVRESAETGRARYAVIADELVGAAREVLADKSLRGVKLWRESELVGLTMAVAIYESGLREDVQTGRGSAKKPDDVGGRGRGPSQEACFLQIHPKVFPAFVPGGADSILGREPAQVAACFRAGMRMLVTARAYCSFTDPGAKLRGYDWVWATVAQYGTGNSCVSANHGKTGLRAGLGRKLIAALGRASS